MSTDPYAVLGQVISEFIAMSRSALHNARGRRAGRAAEREARLAEQQARERRRAWLATVERQMSRGAARDASEAEARALLGGRAGRRNPLDDRRFR